LTAFPEDRGRPLGCTPGPPPGCIVGPTTQDAATRALILDSPCDPFGTNPFGSEIFAINPDGSGLPPLTETRGFADGPDGRLEGGLAGPYVSGAPRGSPLGSDPAGIELPVKNGRSQTRERRRSR